MLVFIIFNHFKLLTHESTRIYRDVTSLAELVDATDLKFVSFLSIGSSPIRGNLIFNDKKNKCINNPLRR